MHRGRLLGHPPRRDGEVTGNHHALLVEDIVVVEVKAVHKLPPIHLAQLLSYLKLGGLPVGLLINFHVAHLRHGIKRMVN